MTQKLFEKLGFLKVKILFTILCLNATILVSFIFFLDQKIIKLIILFDFTYAFGIKGETCWAQAVEIRTTYFTKT